MARLTMEDCLRFADNRYDLVLLASTRARRLSSGSPALVDETDDKPTVVALREIAAGLITKENVRTIDRSVEASKEDGKPEPGSGSEPKIEPESEPKSEPKSEQKQE